MNQDEDLKSGDRGACEVAYFSAEFGVKDDLPTYAGGLGVLAGDTIKEAADAGFEMVAVGVLYKGIKGAATIDETGWQEEDDVEFDPVGCGLELVKEKSGDQPLLLELEIDKSKLMIGAWRYTIGSVELYLLDTDIEQNNEADRLITQALYYGDEKTLIKQQLVLGIGGAKLLRALEIEPKLFHLNEGRPAFLFWELVRGKMDEGMDYQKAMDEVKNMIVYTNHTLVRAGNQAYNQKLLTELVEPYTTFLKVPMGTLLEPGIDEGAGGVFSMSEFALNTSHRASAVSQIHYELSKEQWPEFDWVGITNGIHLPSWQDSDVRNCDKSGSDLWLVHEKKKMETAEFVRQRTGFGYDPNRMVICWARRIALYKRPDSIVADIARLERIVKNAQRPVQLLLSGKAHAADTAAKEVLQKIVGYMQKELSDHALFVPNYNMEVARHLARGVDLWINTPVMGKEASGTSGMKAIANGVLQLTVKDGWAKEVDWHDVGWTLDAENISETLYFRLEEDIVPLFYRRDTNNIPWQWLERMKRSVELAERFCTRRMFGEYQDKLYGG